MSTPEVTINVERLDDMPLLYGFVKKMGIQTAIDAVIQAHGNWEGLSIGWVVSIWLIHIASVYNHRMDRVQEWVAKHLVSLKQLTGQEVRELDFSDDRLAICLRELHWANHWPAIESLLGKRLVRVYELEVERVRLDATTGGVYHELEQDGLFQVGKNKQGEYEKQYKLMLAGLDPLGLTVAMDVVAGNRADDPLYVPCYRRVKKILDKDGLLIVGDSKMSALHTRRVIVTGKDSYLTPLPHDKSEPELLDKLLNQFQASGQRLTSIFLPDDLPQDGSEPEPELAIAEGFEVSREHSVLVGRKEVSWQERCLVVRSFGYQQTMQNGLTSRLTKAEAALRQLTPEPGRGKRQIGDEKSLKVAIARIEKRYKVAGLFRVTYTQQVQERHIRRHKDKPARTERKVRFQLEVERNQPAIDQAMFHAGWRIYLTNAAQEQLSLTKAVLAYRDQYLEENIFRRLKGKMLSITPLYIQRDDHAQGLLHLLSLAARLLALGDYTARQSLAKQHEELNGIYPGNPKRSTAKPTMERMLEVFDNINLTMIHLADQTICQVTPLTPTQVRILSLLGLPASLYTNWTTAV